MQHSISDHPELMSAGDGKLSQVFFENVRDGGKVRLEYLDGLLVEINRGKTFKARSLQPQAEAAAAAEKIKESGFGCHGRKVNVSKEMYIAKV